MGSSCQISWKNKVKFIYRGQKLTKDDLNWRSYLELCKHCRIIYNGLYCKGICPHWDPHRELNARFTFTAGSRSAQQTADRSFCFLPSSWCIHCLSSWGCSLTSQCFLYCVEKTFSGHWWRQGRLNVSQTWFIQMTCWKKHTSKTVLARNKLMLNTLFNCICTWILSFHYGFLFVCRQVIV